MNNKSRQGRTNVKIRKLDLEEFQYKRIGVKALGLCPEGRITLTPHSRAVLFINGEAVKLPSTKGTDEETRLPPS